MYVDIPVGGPDLAPASTETTDQTNARSVAAKTVAAKAIEIVTSRQARFAYRVMFTATVALVGLSLAVGLHVLVRGTQAGVNALLFAWWAMDLTILLVSCLCTMSWSCRRRPLVWHVAFSTNSWLSVSAAQRVWGWTAVVA